MNAKLGKKARREDSARQAAALMAQLKADAALLDITLELHADKTAFNHKITFNHRAIKGYVWTIDTCEYEQARAEMIKFWQTYCQK